METPLRLSRNMLHGWKDNSVLAKPLAACTQLSATVSQLFEPQLPKIAVFTYRSPHFCFPWRRPCDYHAICCMDRKTIQCLPNRSQHVPIYLQQFPSYSNRNCQKSPFSRTAAHIFVSPRRPCDFHAICCTDGKTMQCLPNPSQHVPIYFQQFPSYSNRSMYLFIFNSFRVIRCLIIIIIRLLSISCQKRNLTCDRE